MKPAAALALTTLALAFFVTACGDGSPSSKRASTAATTASTPARAPRLKVVAALYPLAWVAEQVGGGRYDVTTLTPIDTQPRDYAPSAEELDALRSADVVLYAGGGFQPKLEAALADVPATKLDILDAPGTQPQPPAAGTPEADAGLAVDPRLWLDPIRFRTVALWLSGQLDGADARAMAQEVTGVAIDYKLQLGGCTATRVTVLTPSFGYLTDRYGLTQVRGDAGPTKLDRLDAVSVDALDAGADYVSLQHDNAVALRAGLGCPPLGGD
ncbi:MAG: hypothetical protein JWN72_762 [Thermoleophilia bacterium]|nr:hypothetical protein [Thermoleophilia bacterium]